MISLKKNLLLLSCFPAVILCVCVKVPEHCGDGYELNPETEFCFGNKSYKKCGGGEYNPDKEFCSGNIAFNLCGGNEYNPSEYNCVGEILTPQTTTPAVFTITFNANGGTVSPATGVTGADSTLATTLPAPTRNGYNFDGWFTAATDGTAVGASTKFSTHITIYAHWTFIPPTAFTITFNANGGTVSPATGITGADSALATSLPTPTRTGYIFDGWFSATTGGTAVEASTKFSAHSTIYAHWTLIPPTIFTITFNANSGTVSPATGVTGADSTLATLPTPTRTGYNFDGWFSATTGGTAVEASTKFSAHSTIYAHWTLIPPTIFTITFNANSGTVSPATGVTGADSTLATLPTPTRTGYNFDGWFSATTGGTAVEASTKFSAHSTIYAHWTLIPPTIFTITFNANYTGGTVSPPTATTGADSTLATTLPTPTRIGYTLAGWYTTATGDVQVTASTKFTQNANIYARWTATSYTITYILDGGTVTPTNVNPGSYTIETATITLVNPSKTGYTFAGWTGSNGTTAQTTVTIPLGSTDNKTYTANWGLEFVTIRGMKWTKKNLNIETEDSWCYNDSPDSCAKYGRLYTWAAAKTACPSGWHLPTYYEWEALDEAAGGTGNWYANTGTAGKKLKSKTGWYNNGNGTDDLGFSGLPGGKRGIGGNFYGIGYYGYWWTDEVIGVGNYAYGWEMMYNSDLFSGYDGDLNVRNGGKSEGLSVRCIYDD